MTFNNKQFIIKSPRTEKEKEGLYQLHSGVHGDLVGHLCRKLLDIHPVITDDNFFIAVDASNGLVVSSLALIPWELQYFGAGLKCAELGIVATHADYRGKGLMTELMAHFNRRFIDDGYDLGIIQGIPGFYDRYGYHYCIPLENQIILELHSITVPYDETIPIENANDGDIRTVSELYMRHNTGYDITSLHTPDTYRFLMRNDYASETDSDIFVVRINGAAAGYFRINYHGFTDGLQVSEVSDMDYDTCMTVLSYMKNLAIERGKPYIKLCLPDFHPLAGIAYSLGACKRWSYEWQVKINLPLFIIKIAPHLEERIARSMFVGLSGRLEFFLYETGIALDFSNGKIIDIRQQKGRQEDCALSIGSFYKLLTGSSSPAEIIQNDRTAFINGRHRLLLDVLFPPARSYLYCPY